MKRAFSEIACVSMQLVMFLKFSAFSPVLTMVLARGIQREYDVDNLTAVLSAEFPKFFSMFADPLSSYMAFLATVEIQHEVMEHNTMPHSEDDDINRIKKFVRRISALQCVFKEKLITRNDKV